MKHGWFVSVPVSMVLAFYPVALPAADKAAVNPQKLFEETCSACHSTDVPKGERFSSKDWEEIVTRMRTQNGCSISDAEARTIIEYLSANYGKK